MKRSNCYYKVETGGCGRVARERMAISAKSACKELCSTATVTKCQLHV